MVRVHQARVGGDNAVAVRVGVVAGGQVELVAVVHQRGHGVRAGAVHADLAVGVQRHKPPGGVHVRVDHLEVQPVALADRAPVVHGRAAHRVSADVQAGRLDRVHVHHVAQVGNVVVEVVELPGALVQHARDRGALHTVEACGDVLVGALGNPIRRLRRRRAAGGRVVLEAAVARRVVGRGHHNAVGLAAGVGQDGVGDGRGGSVAPFSVDKHRHPIGDEHLERGDHRRLGQGVGVAADVDRPVDALAAAVVHDRLRGGQDVRLVKRVVQGRAAVAGGAEGDLLVRVVRVDVAGVVGGDHLGDVDEVVLAGGLSGALVCHGNAPCVSGRVLPTIIARECFSCHLYIIHRAVCFTSVHG